MLEHICGLLLTFYSSDWAGVFIPVEVCPCACVSPCVTTTCSFGAIICAYIGRCAYRVRLRSFYLSPEWKSRKLTADKTPPSLFLLTLLAQPQSNPWAHFLLTSYFSEQQRIEKWENQFLQSVFTPRTFRLLASASSRMQNDWAL